MSKGGDGCQKRVPRDLGETTHCQDEMERKSLFGAMNEQLRQRGGAMGVSIVRARVPKCNKNNFFLR